MPTSTAYARSRARVVRKCDTVDDARTLRLQLLETIRQAVGFDAYAWLLTDPETSVGSSPLADVPCLPELPRAIRLKYLTEVNRWTTMSGGSVGLLHVATGGDPALSLLWRELLRAYEHQRRGVVGVQGSIRVLGFLDLWRSGVAARFSQPEATFLTAIVEPVTMALRRCQANTFGVGPTRDPRRLGPVVLLLSPDLEVRAQTPETQEFLRVLVPPIEGRAPIPASAYNVAAQLSAVEAGVDRNPPMARVHLLQGLWVTLRAARIGGGEQASVQDIAVTIETTSPTERAALFARAFGFSARAHELLGHLVTGPTPVNLPDGCSFGAHGCRTT